MITRETDYALRALLCLATRGQGQVIATSAMAEEMDIPYRFLRRILQKLHVAGLVGSSRGKTGGVWLRPDPASLSLRDVVFHVDPSTVTLNACLIDGTACNRVSRCVVHDELVRVQAILEHELSTTTLAELVQREKDRQTDMVKG